MFFNLIPSTGHGRSHYIINFGPFVEINVEACKNLFGISLISFIIIKPSIAFLSLI